MKAKRLLLLGGVTQTIPFVKKAKELGYITYVADYILDSPAKRTADISVDIDCLDVDALYQYVVANEIDGVLVGCADRLLVPYYELCKKLGICCYVNEDLLKVFNNKRGLKDFLRLYGMPVIPEYEYDVKHNKFTDEPEFPCFVKPVDCNSAKGMSICFDKKMIHIAIEKALNASCCKDILVEKVMRCDNVVVELYLENGNVHLRSVCDRYVSTEMENAGTLPLCLVYPSKYTDLYMETLHGKMCKLLQKLDFTNGVVSFEAFVEGDKIMFYDPALRFTGAEEYVLYDYANGTDLLKSLVRFAIDGVMEPLIQAKGAYLYRGLKAANLVILIKTGKIGQIEGIDELQNISGVINVTQCHFVGDEVIGYGTLDQTIARVHIVSDSIAELKKAIGLVLNSIVVLDDRGKSMIINQFDIEELNNY